MKIKSVCRIVLILFCSVLVTSSCISYKFNGASINYDKIKSITIENFSNRSALVWGPMEPKLNTAIKDIYAQQTRLKLVNKGGDLQIGGEITGYEQSNKSIAADGYTSMNSLRLTINVRFTNNTNHAEDFEQQFSATRDFDAKQQLASVQEELVNQMIKEIVDQIFNATVANW